MKYYSTFDSDDFITADSIHQALVDWYDGLDNILEFQEEVLVYEYEPVKISDKQVGCWLETFIENLDEAYGCAETWGDYTPSEEALSHWKAFTDKVKEEYKVSELKEIGRYMVSVRDHITVDLEEDFK